jgi:predicted HTH domain antitoxin
MTDLIIPGSILERAEMTPSEFLVEMAVYLYGKEKISIGQAKDLAGLDLISFQQALSQRDVHIHYDVEDYYEDVKNLDKLE